MRIVILGAPGSGKGTQAAKLKSELKIAHISTGDLLRGAVASGSALGMQAKAVMDAGKLVSDEIVLGMLEERLKRADTQPGFILDGYPRNVAQCAAMEGLLQRLGRPLDVAIKLKCDTELVVRRLAERARLEGRADDTPETVRERQRVYSAQTAPVVEHFREIGQLVVVDGVGEVNEVFARILGALRALELG